MEIEELWRLASRSSVALAKESTSLAGQKARHQSLNLMRLATTLMSLHIILENPTPGQFRAISEGLIAFLGTLETLVSVSLS